MKIIVNAISARRGGIVTYTNNLAHSLLERKIDVTFAISDDFEMEPGIKTIRLPAQRMSPIRRTLWEQLVWRYIVMKQDADILFSSANFGLLKPPIAQILLVREGGLFDPFYLTNIAPSLNSLTTFNRIARRKLIIASARASNVILTPSETMKQLLISWDKDLKSKVHVNKYGTVPMFYKTKGHNRKWRADGILKILYVSAYYPHKQPGLIAEALAKLNSMGIKSKATITMDINSINGAIGGEKDYLMLKKGISRNQIDLIGDQSYKSLPDIYKSHDLFVFPSLSETFGHPLAEAMSVGIPIIASDTHVHKEICGDAALYFSATQPSNLVEKVRILDKNRELSRKITANGRRNIAKNLIWTDHVDRLVDIFRKTTKNYTR